MKMSYSDAGNSSNKRRRTSRHSLARINELPDEILVGVSKYLSRPSRALLAVALDPTPSTPVLERSKAILAASMESDESDHHRQWEVLDFIEFEEKQFMSLNTLKPTMERLVMTSQRN